MKKLILPVTLIAMALLETACSSDKDSTASANACWSSAYTNTAACQQVAQAAQAAATSVSQAEIPSTANKTSALLAQTGTSNPAVAKSEVGITTASVPTTSNEAIKAQSIKIQSALQSYANNPDSSYYDPASPTRTVASVNQASDIAPASVAAAAPVTQSVVESSMAEPAVATQSVSGSTSR